jgi:hypothetical protein
MATANSKSNRQQLDDWMSRLAALIDLVDAWVTAAGWSTRRVEKKMQDSEFGTYQAPALLMQEGTTRVILEPIARSAPGADGVVDLYLLPAYDDIASLYLYAGGWNVHYPFPGDPLVPVVEEIPPRPLSEETLKEILEEMAKNAA